MKIVEFLRIPLFQRAMLGAFLAGSTLSLLGVVVVTANLTTIRFALMHLALLGGAVALAFKLPLLAGALGGIMVASLILGPWAERFKIDPGMMSAYLMTGSLGFAFILFYRAGVPAMEVFSLFTGGLLLLNLNDLFVLLFLGVVLLFVFWAFYYEIELFLYDQEMAEALGVPIRLLQTGLIFLTGLAIGVAMRVVGALMVDAIIVIPALTALSFARGLKEGLIFTSLFGVIASVGGLFLSMGADLPVGASITVSAVALLAIVNLLKNKLNFRRRS